MTPKQFGKEFRSEFFLEDGYIPVNHGSFGVYPKVLHSTVTEYRENAERHPDRWNRFQIKPIIEENYAKIAEFVHCDANELCFAANASNGVNTILRSFPFKAGDKILCYQTAYISVDKTLEFLKNQYGVELVRITLNYPIEDADVVDLTKQAIERENATGKPIRMVVVDAISSLPGVLFPFQPVLQLAKENNILSLLDGAHAIGHIDLDLHEMGPDFFVANCHKWLYTPRGCAIVYVAKRNQGYIHPTTINAFYQHHDDPSDSNTFNDEHFPGTVDCSQFMVVGKAIEYRKSIGGELAIRQYAHKMATEGGDIVANILGTQVMDNSTHTLITCMSNVELPVEQKSSTDGQVAKFIMTELVFTHHTMATVYKTNNKWWVRLCGQIYLDLDDFKQAGEALLAACNDFNKQEQ